MRSGRQQRLRRKHDLWMGSVQGSVEHVCMPQPITRVYMHQCSVLLHRSPWLEDETNSASPRLQLIKSQ